MHMIYYFLQNSADELYLLFEQFCDHFYAISRNLLYMNFISSHSNNIHALEQLQSIKNKASSFSQVKHQYMNMLHLNFVIDLSLFLAFFVFSFWFWCHASQSGKILYVGHVVIYTTLFLFTQPYLINKCILQFVKKMLASLPFSCQSLSPSPYFDQSLFRFDEKV